MANTSTSKVMDSVLAQGEEPAQPHSPMEGHNSQKAIHQQIRGSSLLLAGRVLSTALGFVAQVLIVRHLSTVDYGAFAYALAIVAACQGFSTLGINRSISRFVPIYLEKQDRERIAGTIVLSIGISAITLVVIIISVLVLPNRIWQTVLPSQNSFYVIAVLVFLLPVEAVNELLVSLFASFGKPKVIFFRSHVLGPSIRLAVVLALIAFHAGVEFLAMGYVLASLVGVLIYALLLARFFAQAGVLRGVRIGNIKVPAKEMLSFAMPVLTSEIVTSMMMTSTAIFLLGHFHDLKSVAMYRVTVPASRMNLIVMASFSLLFTPLAARLFARCDHRGINDLYWRTTTWMVVLTFPIFLLTFSLAQPLTSALYGARYASSAMILALLSLGLYFNVALGFNTLTLRVLGRVRSVLVVNLLVVVINVGLNLALIPRYSAMGAAFATTASMIALNLLTQYALSRATDFEFFQVQYVWVYVFIAFTSTGLFVLEQLVSPPWYVSITLAAAACGIVLLVCRKTLRMTDSFPEMRRFPILRVIFS